MPDLWTTNPETLRKMLKDAGVKCGMEARVLKPRDPEWTCHVDTPEYIGDIYIHPLQDFYELPVFYAPLLILTILGIFIGLLWGRYFWHKPDKTHSLSAQRR